MSRTKMFFYNTLSAAISQLVIMIVGFVLPRVIMTRYGSEINGLVSSATQFIGYITLVQSGLSGAAIFALYKPLTEDDYASTNGILSATRLFFNQTGVIFVIFVVILSFVYPLISGVETLGYTQVIIFVLLLSINSIIEFFIIGKYKVLLIANQHMYIITIAYIVYTILYAFILVCMTLNGLPVVLSYATAIVPSILRALFIVLYCRHKYRYLNMKVAPLKDRLDKRWSAFFLELLGVVQSGAPIILITIFLNLSQVSIFSVYNLLMAGLAGLFGIFSSGLASSFGEIITRKDQKTLRKTYTVFEYVYYTMITLAYSIAMIMLLPFIRIYTSGITDADYFQPLLGFLFVLNGYLYNLKTPQGMLVISAGLYKETKIQTSIQAGILLIFGLILTPFMGLWGIVLSMCLSNLYRVVDLMFYIPKNVTHLPVSNTFWRIIRSIVIGLLIYTPFILISPNPSNYLSWFIYAIICGIWGLVVTLIFSLIFERRVIKDILSYLKLFYKKRSNVLK